MNAAAAILALLVVAALAGVAYQVAREPGWYTQTLVVKTPEGYGTGWWLNSEGYIVTAYHVVRGYNGSIQVIRGPWNSTAYITAYDPTLDVAVLRVQEPPDWARGLPLSPRIYLGQRVLVVGYPVQLFSETGEDYRLMSKSPRAAEGVVSWLHPTEPIAEFSVETDAGNSGGPVLDSGTHAVVGIVVYARKGVAGYGYYMLRSDAIASFLDTHGIPYRIHGTGAQAMAYGVGAAAILAAALVALRRR